MSHSQKFRAAVLQFLGVLQYVLRRHSDAIGSFEIAERRLNAIASLGSDRHRVDGLHVAI